MWLVAEFLLGFVVLATLAGFHVGPHSHLAAGIGGVLAAIWLLIMAATGQAEPLLWIVLGADVAVSAGVGTMAWKGLETSKLSASTHPSTRLVGAEGIAASALEPQGIVNIRGESWSATSLNGRVEKGRRVQVIEIDGIHLGVWGEESLPAAPPRDFSSIALEDHAATGESPEDPMTGAS